MTPCCVLCHTCSLRSLRSVSHLQYNQSDMGRTMWFLNMIMRAALHWLAPWVFSPQTFFMIQQSELSYSQVSALGGRGLRLLTWAGAGWCGLGDLVGAGWVGWCWLDGWALVG